jgi:mono/diheme cytochrome c family protein
VRRLVAPLAAGLVAAALAYAIAGAVTGDGDERRAATPSTTTPATARAGRAVFAMMGCGSCHRLSAAGSRGAIGPSLDERLPAHSATSLRAAIVDPPAGVMPEDFGQRMSSTELDALVRFLLEARGRR